MGFKDKYRLELHWESFNSDGGEYSLSGAYFSGPALKIAKEINSSDRIVLDLTPQYSKIISKHYFVNVVWNDVTYIDDKVYLVGVKLEGDFVGSFAELSNKNYIVIDTALHEEDIHVFNLVYAAQLVDDLDVAKC